MCRRVIIFILVIIPIIHVYGGNELTYTIVEQTSYELYSQQHWDELIRFGKKAIHNHIDYYYLRMRMGTACFELERYLSAAIHFEQAIAFNPIEITGHIYLFYCYLYTDNLVRADKIKGKLPASYSKKLPEVKNKGLRFINFEAGPVLNNAGEKAKNIPIDGKDDIYGEIDLPENGYYANVGFKYAATRNLSFYFGFSDILLRKQKKIEILDQVTVDDHYQLNEYQSYGNVTIRFGDRYTLTSALNYSYYNYSTVYAVYDSIINTYIYNRRAVPVNNYLVSLALTRHDHLIRTSVFSTVSHLNSDQQILAGFGLIFFPLGSDRFYTSSTLMDFYQENKNSLIFDQMLGWFFTKGLWGEVKVTLGRMRNYSEYNAFIVYDIPDTIKFKCGLSLNALLRKHLHISVNYKFMEREGKYLAYERRNPSPYSRPLPAVKTYSYSTHIITGGFIWNF
jgi:tetratricopeptide (TPR) repeat protein